MADNLVSKELNILFFQAQTVVFFLFVPLFKLDNKVDRLGILYALDTKQRLDVDDTDTAQLDEMAWEFNIDWWDSSFSLETKRSVIRTCYRVHEKRGTKWAVEELITSAFGMGKVTEWFEYGGQPYWFKIQTSATLTKDGMLYFLNMIDKVKNARSHVEMIEVTRTIQQPLHGGTAYHSFSKCVVLDLSLIHI